MKSTIPTDPAKAAALARDVGTAAETLAELAKSELTFLREEVARHPNATPDLLLSLVPERLESDNERRVATALASNPATPGPALAALLQLLKPERVDGSRRENWGWEGLAVATLTHELCPERDALAFLRSSHLSKRRKVQVAESTSAEGVLRFLLEDPSEQVRRPARMRLAVISGQVVP